MCCTPTSTTCITALRSVKEERQLNSATWRDSCTLNDTGFGEPESVSSRRLLVSALILAPSCGCCLPPLFSLDQDETEWDSALFLLHSPHHTHMLDVGLPLALFYLTLKSFLGWRKCVTVILLVENLRVFCVLSRMVAFWIRCLL